MSKDDPSNPPGTSKGKPKFTTIIRQGDWPVTISQGLLRDGKVAPAAKVLYGILASYANTDCPMPFPALPKLCKHLGQARKAVQRHLKELETWGLLVRYHCKENGKFHSTRYEIKPYKPAVHRAKRGLRKTGLIPARKPQGQNGPTSMNHSNSAISSALKLVRVTPLPQSPERMEQAFHGPVCQCIDCRRKYA